MWLFISVCATETQIAAYVRFLFRTSGFVQPRREALSVSQHDTFTRSSFVFEVSSVFRCLLLKNCLPEEDEATPRGRRSEIDVLLALAMLDV